MPIPVENPETNAGWCDCVWHFPDPSAVYGAVCNTCGHTIRAAEFRAASNPFDVLSKHGKACNVRKARKGFKIVQ